MIWLIIVILVLCSCFCEQVTVVDSLSAEQRVYLQVNDEKCPDTWFVRNGFDGECKCGHTLGGVVSCNEETREVRVLDCYCITYDSATNKTVLGECLYNCLNVSSSYYDYMYHPVPRDLVRGDDNNSVCGYLHRNGTLCGQCVEGYYRAAYSYTFDCIKCESSQWLLYIVVAYGPLTIFIIFILVFRVSVASPKLYGVISILQSLASPLNLCIIQEAAKHEKNVYRMVEIFLASLSIWNLDFFRNIIPGICLRIDVLQLMALDYLIAVYPMVVTVIAFFILQMYYHGFGPVQLMCRPFQRVFANFRQSWNLHTTLIDAFVTFFILSTTKILHVSVSVLVSVRLRDPEDNKLDLVWYEDASIKFFDSYHRWYGLVAIIAITVLIIMPIALLMSYQFTFCQVCLTKTRIKGRVLEDFMYSFNQYYKDGSGGTMDCRWFAAFPILARLGMYLLLLYPPTGLFYNQLQLCIFVLPITVVVLQPYKDEYSYQNRLEPCVYLVLALIISGITGVNISNLKDRVFVKSMFMFTASVAFVPIVYLSALTVRWVWKRTPFSFRLTNKSLSSDLPDRLINSADYENMSTSYITSN